MEAGTCIEKLPPTYCPVGSLWYILLNDDWCGRAQLTVGWVGVPGCYKKHEEQTSKQGSSIASASVSAMSSLDGGLTTGSELK